MTAYRALYRKAVQTLRQAGNPDAAFDVRCLMEQVFGLDRAALSRCENCTPDEKNERRFRELLSQRAAGEPLQYLLGMWGFLDDSFQVGPGVLIPRPETELLAQIVLSHMEHLSNPIVLDLCAGSGCLGLSIAKQRPDAQVYLLEKSPEAFPFLRSNAQRIANGNAHLVLGDLMNGLLGFKIPAPHVIVSNPPYIKSDEIAVLQREVRREPRMALDGGADGLRFYRALAGRWAPFLRDGGFIAVECGEGQAEAIQAMFRKEGLHTRAQLDYSGIPRIVEGWRRFGPAV